MKVIASRHLTKRAIKQGSKREIIKTWDSLEEFYKETLAAALKGKKNVDQKAKFIGLQIVKPELDILEPERYSSWEKTFTLFWLDKQGLDIAEVTEKELETIRAEQENRETVKVNGIEQSLNCETVAALKKALNIAEDSKISIQTNLSDLESCFNLCG